MRAVHDDSVGDVTSGFLLHIKQVIQKQVEYMIQILITAATNGDVNHSWHPGSYGSAGLR